jgi:hypothetical protein
MVTTSIETVTKAHSDHRYRGRATTTSLGLTHGRLIHSFFSSSYAISNASITLLQALPPYPP